MQVKKITANLYVDEVEPCAKFWVDRMGFEKTVEVPDGDKLAFAILAKGDLEVMYGSYASLRQDREVAAAIGTGASFLYLEVENLDPVIAAMQGAEVVKPEHTTFYGAREISVKDPAGHIITFAQQAV